MFAVWERFGKELQSQETKLTQVRHWEGQKRVKSFEISLGYGRVCTTFLNLERL